MISGERSSKRKGKAAGGLSWARAWPGAGKEDVAEAEALFFQFVEEAASPDVFGGEDAEAEHDGEPSWAGSEDHDGADGEQGESEEDSKEAFGLL